MRWYTAAVLWLGLCCSGVVFAASESIPPPLDGWQTWVLDGHEHVGCPYVDGNVGTSGGIDVGANRVCVWPGTLDLRIDGNVARFSQRVRLYTLGWLPLPGDAESWPQDVTADGTRVPVLQHEGQPGIELAPGEHTIAGLVSWVARPDVLPVPTTVGLVRLTVDGRSIGPPERAGGTVRLGAARVKAEANQLDVQVYRKLTDSLPGILRTRVQLRVAGEARETTIGPLLPAGFTPLQLGGQLPARLDPEGRMRIQLRAGTWWLELVARSDSALDRVAMPAGLDPEVWSFESVDRLRSVSVEGVPPTDPSQSSVPGDWQSLPAFRLEPGAELRIVERSRGMSGQDLNRVAVERDLWWDFDAGGYTFRDRVSGTLQQGWRLDMSPPFALQGARSSGQALLVTSRNDHAGVEVRTPQLDLEATGRVEKPLRKLPATGWEQHLTNLGLNLHLPPGHRLLAALGVDYAGESWVARWRLLDMFIVLLVTAVAFRLAGIPVAALALIGLVLAHQEAPALTWVVLNVLIAIALARFAPDGRLRRFASIWQAVSFVLVLVVYVPFALQQARLAFFPQLDAQGPIAFAGGAVTGAVQTEIMEDSATAVPAEPAMEAELAKARNVPRDESRVMSGSRKDALESVRPAAPPPIIQRYSADSMLQNGPGVPGWRYQSYRLQWSGPVEPSQVMRVVVLTPFWVSLWRLAAIALIGALLAQFVGSVYARLRSERLARWLAPRGPGIAAAALLSLATLSMTFVPTRAVADTPSQELLNELARRLTEPPTCAPTCVSVAASTVRVDNGTLEVRLEAHAGAASVLRLPQAPQRWIIDGVVVDGSPARGLSLDAAGTLLTPLERGVHSVTISGRLVAADSLRLAFPAKPARIDVNAPGWEIGGVERGRLLGDGLSLIRVRTVADTEELVAEEFPPYVRVIRTLTLDLDWRVDVQVERLAPVQGAFVLELPLLPGESVLTSGVPVRDRRAVIAFPAGAQTVAWTSSLARAENLPLVAPSGVPWVEVWRLNVSPLWHIEMKGTTEVFPPDTDSGAWVRQFEPRPGESLELTISRPPGVEGATFAFERVDQRLAVGRRATDVALQLDYRSTQGGRHVIKLPDGARLQSVLADGQPLTLDLRDGELALPLQPGEHSLQIAWQVDRGVHVATRPDIVDLKAPASNVATHIALPDDRWTLFARGGGVGPAILYWAELVLFVVIAVLLGRFAPSLLATRDWLLVGLGLSTFSWSVLLLFAAWIFAMQWRSNWRDTVPPGVFNGVQVLLVLLTLVALGSLLSAIPNGLLGRPNMRIEDPMFDYSGLNWFHDRVPGVLPQPVVISVSLWFYKAAMLAWALWLSFTLVRWVRWAWAAFNSSQLWMRTPGSTGPLRPQPPSPPPEPPSLAPATPE
jgi:hypothetical protein